MADSRDLALIRRGVKAWNRWRESNLFLTPRLSDANLRGANLAGANFFHTDLREANLMMANLIGADLSHTSLLGANLSWADLTQAKLTGADLTDADFTEATFGWTLVADVDLRSAKGLETILHREASIIGIETIYKSKLKIPDMFLRGCGVPESFIRYVRKRVVSKQAIPFYSCFISYTEKDDAFSERLYNDLQAAGVRCWRWREDAKWGKSIWGSVDEAVRMYDKLVVVCSKHSLKAPPVIREIERALQKEDDHIRAGKPGEVLFPIRLDDHLFKTWQHHRKADVLAKNVGDFRKWKDPAAYSVALKRLIRDLAAEPAVAAKKGK
jgi:hypothetical protein